MKKIMCKTILLSIFVAPSLFANTKYLEPGFHHNFGLESYYYAYRETVNGNFLMQDKGPMFGVYYDFAFQPENTSFRFGGEGRTAYSSNIHYHSNGTGDAKHRRYQVFEARLLGSYTMAFENQWMIEEYIGLGIRYLITPQSGRRTTTGHGDYLRKSQYNYIPIGIRIIKELDNGMKWVGYLEYDWFLSGLQKSYIHVGTVKNRQPHGYGARIGVDLRISSPTDCFSYTVGIFARYWNIKDSVIGFDDYYEPKNNTQELGVRVGLVF